MIDVDDTYAGQYVDLVGVVLARDLDNDNLYEVLRITVTDGSIYLSPVDRGFSRNRKAAVKIAQNELTDIGQELIHGALTMVEDDAEDEP